MYSYSISADGYGKLIPFHYTASVSLSYVSHLALIILRTGILNYFSLNSQNPPHSRLSIIEKQKNLIKKHKPIKSVVPLKSSQSQGEEKPVDRPGQAI